MTLYAPAPTFMARNRTAPPPYEPTQASTALKVRRVQLGKSQADVAFDSQVLTQTTVSELERGKYGPEDLTAARLSALARGLNWSVAELEEATGLELNLTSKSERGVPKPSDAFTAKARGYRVPKPPRPALPDPLVDAGRLYGDKPGFEGLRERRWQYYMADLPHRRRPQTPEEWLALYIDLRDRYDPPEVEE